MKTLRLTAPARATLQEIIKYTIEVFGVQQAKRYQQQLILTAEKLCNNQFPLGRDCSLLLDERSNRPSVAMRLKETRWQSLLKKRITRLIMWLNCVS